MRISLPLRALGATLTFAALSSLVGCGSDPTYDHAEEFPVVALGDNSCTRVETRHVDVATWATAADEFVVGTVTSVSAVWDRNFDEEGNPVYATCLAGIPALDITLSEVTSLKTAREFQSVTLRMGAPAVQRWLDAGYRLPSTFGLPSASWEAPDDKPAPLEIGSIIATAYYTVDDFNVIMSHAEPLLAVDESDRLFSQEFTHTDCDFVGLTVAEVAMGLTGKKLSYLQGLLDILSAVDFPDNEPQRYRIHLGLNNIITADPFTGGICTTVQGVGGDNGDDGNGDGDGDGNGDGETP